MGGGQSDSEFVLSGKLAILAQTSLLSEQAGEQTKPCFLQE